MASFFSLHFGVFPAKPGQTCVAPFLSRSHARHGRGSNLMVFLSASNANPCRFHGLATAALSPKEVGRCEMKPREGNARAREEQSVTKGPLGPWHIQNRKREHFVTGSICNQLV